MYGGFLGPPQIQVRRCGHSSKDLLKYQLILLNIILTLLKYMSDLLKKS